MNTMTFDTLKFVETLENAGVERKQAAAFAVAVQQAQETSNVATKADLSKLEITADSRFDFLRKEIELVRKDMEVMRKDIIIKLGVMLMAGFGTIIGVLFKLLG